jgi:hypothetical protein
MEMGLVQTTKMGSAGGGRFSGPGLAEYLLVVYPDGELRERLLEEQQQFSSDYGLGQRAGRGQTIGGNKPHITLAVFQAGEEAEDMMIRWIRRICQQRRSFETALNNYSGIPPHTLEPPKAGASLRTSSCQGQERSSRPPGQTLLWWREHENFFGQRVPGTICVRVQDPEPLRELMQQLGAIDDFIQSSGWPPVRHPFTTKSWGRPYLSIAGGLTEQVYNKAMPDYSRKTFHGTFWVRELVLLKRKHSFDPCKTVNVFGLKS